MRREQLGGWIMGVEEWNGREGCVDKVLRVEARTGGLKGWMSCNGVDVWVRRVT